METLVQFRYIDDDPPKDGSIELLDGSGEFAYKTRFGTFLTYNTGLKPIRHFKIVKLQGRRLMAELLEIL